MEYSYKELARIGAKYYHDNNFCTVVALAVTCGQAFGKAYHTMKRLGRQDGKGSWAVLDGVKTLGYTAERVEGLYGKQVKSLNKLLPRTGMYMVFVRGHVLAVRNGEVVDWTEGRAHRIIRVYKIERV
jgi:hypothetical protein